jgi:hypothetical protein
MNETRPSTYDLSAVLDRVREHLLNAQKLVDDVAPNSIIGARLQHLLDDVEQQLCEDVRAASRGALPD